MDYPEESGNEVWLEAAKQNFEEAMEVENFALARAVIEDLKENGFADSALVLEREMITKQNHE